MSFSYREKEAARESKLGSRAVSFPVKTYNLWGICPRIVPVFLNLTGKPLLPVKLRPHCPLDSPSPLCYPLLTAQKHKQDNRKNWPQYPLKHTKEFRES